LTVQQSKYVNNSEISPSNPRAVIPAIFMNLTNPSVIMKNAMEDVAYKSKLMTRNVKVPKPSRHFKIYSANPTKLDFTKETLLNALLPNIKKGEVIYDIGANIGLYTLAIAESNLDNSVFAFEPNPETFAKLKANLFLNKASDKVNPLQIAVGNTIGESTFMLSTEQERSSLFQSGASFGNAKVKKIVKVPVKTVDSLIGQLPPPQHIKIDAEGSEALILEGAEKTIRKYKPLLYIEPHSFALEDQISIMLQLLDYEFENYQGHYICNPIGTPKPIVTKEVLALA
jgi:FkbM family methyltransferase